MTAGRIRVTGFTSTQLPYKHSAAIVLSWPTICMYVWLQQPELGSLICPTIR
ncbi:hypothetical protein PR202_gb16079 [Eleusine coracana subsp. coracana]|uniref:Uncharacterized protein n=1 Tax=Eleusine coracana subsp. coracana TaxID=191504 RepID=A0AAV5EZP9_ELECO|nr:hypothetical protein PR202_gb16079 [Eleusine coracana subsp. coracana]